MPVTMPLFLRSTKAMLLLLGIAREMQNHKRRPGCQPAVPLCGPSRPSRGVRNYRLAVCSLRAAHIGYRARYTCGRFDVAVVVARRLIIRQSYRRGDDRQLVHQQPFRGKGRLVPLPGLYW